MRELIKELLHQGDKGHWPEPPTEAEIEKFHLSEDAKDGPTFDNFCLDFSHTSPRDSLWNQRASEIIAEQYGLSYDTDFTADEIRNEFLDRLKRIRDDYHKYVDSNGAGSTARSRGRASAEVTKRRQRRGKRVGTVRLHMT